MIRIRRPRGYPCFGFSLIEVIIIMVIISVGLLGLSSMFGTPMASLSANEDLQKTAQYAQECAERIITQRRNLGFESFETTVFSCGANPSGFSYSSDPPVGATYTGTTTGPCPNGMTCRNVSITVTRDGTQLHSTVDLVLVYH
jgi:Tfp pilus assembly protein PilV